MVSVLSNYKLYTTGHEITTLIFHYTLPLNLILFNSLTGFWSVELENYFPQAKVPLLCDLSSIQ